MNTTYHIGDIFKVKGKPALAVIVEISTAQEEEYSVTYIDPMTHNECERDFGKNAWWTVKEIQKKFAPHRIFKEISTQNKQNLKNSLKTTNMSKEKPKLSESSYEVVYTPYGDIGLAIDVTENNTPIRVLTRYDSHNYDPKLEAGFSEYGRADLVHWIHTNVYLTTKDWKHLSYKKSPELILQELNINTEAKCSQYMTK